ncbi:unnamed protein product [marine sediment metagenome]|uniref:Uncharacterized protein n=1 Tax=marine sediment metagenome TaxID=412755 RepID=X1JKZ7_9ZZZZ
MGIPSAKISSQTGYVPGALGIVIGRFIDWLAPVEVKGIKPDVATLDPFKASQSSALQERPAGITVIVAMAVGLSFGENATPGV